MSQELTKTQLLQGPTKTVTVGGQDVDVEALPVSAADLRTHLWTIYPEKTTDAYLELLIKAATSHIETVTWRKLITQQWRIYLDRWPAGGSGGIRLPYGVVQSVEAVRWLDGDGVDHLLDEDAYIAAVVGPEPVVLPAGGSWPSGTLFDAESIRVDFTCGFGAAEEVPAELRHAVQLLAAHWYETREAVIVGTTVRKVPFAVDALIDPWKIRRP